MDKIHYYSAEPNSRLNFKLLKSVVEGYVQGHYLGWRLFVNEFKSEWNKSLLGVFWNFGEPTILAIVFIILRKGEVIAFGENAPMSYSLYVIYGLLIFQAFFQALTSPMGIFSEANQLLKQTKIHPESLIIQKLYHSIYQSVFKVIIIAVVSCWIGEASIIGFIGFVVVLISLQIFCLFTGFLLSPINAIYTDVNQFVSNLSRPLLFITPIFYDTTKVPQLEWVNKFNPLAIFLDSARTVSSGSFSGIDSNYYIICIITFVLVILGSIYFHLSVPIVADKN